MSRDFTRIAILDRAEPAMRFLHAARELSREAPDSPPLVTLAFHTEPDRGAPFVRRCDEAYDLGSAAFVDEHDGRRKSRYLDYARLTRAFRETGAEAAWVGWGVIAEQVEFAELCEHLGIVFIGPPSHAMRVLGDKIEAKRIAERCGIPVVPWSAGAVETLDEARTHAERLGYPLLFKSRAGGGGRGIRRIERPDQLAEGFERARREAALAVGDPTVFLERAVEGARHVEVQIVADAHGHTWAVGVRDCTIQRRHQKLIEEGPSPVLAEEQDRALRAMAKRIATAAGYENAGTVEFLYDPASRRFTFLEVNTRMQVEHPVTELTTGLDLVKLQVQISRGLVLDGEPPPCTGHAIEVRLNAEDPARGFAPAPGEVVAFRAANGPGIRVDAGVTEGTVVTSDFDPMLAKLIAWGRDRNEALARVERALAETVVLLRGGATNRSFLMGLLAHEGFREASMDSGWVDRNAALILEPPARLAELALIQAALAVYETELARERKDFYRAAARGRPRVREQIGYVADLRLRGQSYKLAVHQLEPNLYRVEVGGRSLEVAVELASGFERWLVCAGRRHRVVSLVDDDHLLVEIEGTMHHIARDDAGVVRAPSPAVVLEVSVEVGQRVRTGERLAVLEAMKMEAPVLAPMAGRVRQVMVIANLQVNAGTPLVVLEPVERAETEETRGRLSFELLRAESGGSADLATRCLRNLDTTRRLMLGYDVDPSEAKRLSTERPLLCRDASGGIERLLAREDEILSIFADLRSLFRREPPSERPDAAEAPRSEEYLFTFVRSLDRAGRELPPAFQERLRRALAHYGCTSLAPAPALDDALVRIFKSRQRLEAQAQVVLRILEERLHRITELRALATDGFRGVLDDLIAVSQSASPAVADVAREVRFRFFDEPLFEAARAQVYAEMEDHLARLVAEPAAADRAARIAALVHCPQPLVGVFANRLAGAELPLRQLMLEVLTLRYYRIRDVAPVLCCDRDGTSIAITAYRHEGKQIHVVATHAEYTAFPHAISRLAPILAELPAGEDVVVDLYGWRAAALRDPESTAAELTEWIGKLALDRPLRRLVVVLGGRGEGRGLASVQHFTFRPGADGYGEERVHRGMHPMMGKRMQLWRLANFDIERLPSVEDVYLFRGVARTNPKDERLFAIAEVRDLTPVRDATGRVTHLPYLERMLMEALAGIRRFQGQRPPRERLFWNRVLLYVRPLLDLSVEDLSTVVHALAPATQGLGLEQVVVQATIPDPVTREPLDRVIRISNPRGAGLSITTGPVPLRPLQPLSEYDQKVVRMRQRGLAYPYEVIRMLTPPRDSAAAELPPGEFTEHDLDESGERLVPVERQPGRNSANVVVGVIRNFTAEYPEGVTRVIALGDPSKAMGAVAEPECRRINAALALARELGVPFEWFPISAGAKISMESGTENMDWIALTLRRLIEFTQAGGEVNVVVNGINVGAQPYWNAEATMLLHTRGILVMTPQAAMVLTGKQALDYSGSVSAEDNFGIGGYERIMGPNGQAQYWARDVGEAAQILLRHYQHTYVAPGERFPRRAATHDPLDRDVCASPHPPVEGSPFVRVGEIFAADKNPDRKLPFDIRSVMQAVIDADHPPLERFGAMRDAEIGVVWDSHLGGFPVCLIGIESHPLPRLGFLPADGPEKWTAGTLFPRSSKKIARAINTASGNRPVVILANLSGFDGSPESMREMQLEYGAEIGRAVVNFRGPMVFCVVSRYHGGAYVVFSGWLNENLEVAAVEGSFASVIGGAPAAAVVFAGDVEARARRDGRVVALEERIAAADGAEKARLRAQLDTLYRSVHSEKLGEVAAEFDGIHSIQRALAVGSLDRILPPSELRPYLIDAVERGIQRASEGAPR
ncbi:MAG: carboxyl transferase domain-containing protein [bacterium]